MHIPSLRPRHFSANKLNLNLNRNTIARGAAAVEQGVDIRALALWVCGCFGGFFEQHGEHFEGWVEAEAVGALPAAGAGDAD
jgi:hypothetical protein